MNFAKFMPPSATKAEWDSEIERICATIVSRAKPLSIYLFGSSLNGPKNAGSDIDLAVIFDSPEEVSEGRKRIFSGEPLSAVSVDILVFDRSSFFEKANRGGIAQIINEEGRLRYGTEIRLPNDTESPRKTV